MNMNSEQNIYLFFTVSKTFTYFSFPIIDFSLLHLISIVKIA